MAKIKLQDGKVVTKDGKPSCECCGPPPDPPDPPDPPFPPSIGCSTSSCSTTGAIIGVRCPISYYRANLYKAGGTWTLNWNGTIEGSADYTGVDQQRKTKVTASGTRTVTTTNNCNPLGSNSYTGILDEGGLYRLSTGELLIPSGNKGFTQAGFTIQIRQTTTSPRRFCMTLNLSNPTLGGEYFDMGGGTQFFTDFTFNGCTLTRGFAAGLRSPYNGSPYFPSNIQGSVEFNVTLSFSSSAP